MRGPLSRTSWSRTNSRSRCGPSSSRFRSVRVFTEPARRGSNRPKCREVKPVYPFADLVRQKKEDPLLLEAVVNADGSVGDIRTLYVRHREFEAAAHSALKQWQFRPATLMVSIPVIVHVEMKFTLLVT
jgi:hypothetical protein